MNNQEFREEKNILGVRIDNVSPDGIKERIENVLASDSGDIFISTLNPEILLKAHRDSAYKEILNSADLNICDGFGIRLVSFLKNMHIIARFAGADLVDFLLEKAGRNDLSVLVVVVQNSLSKPDEIEQAISKKYPNISLKCQYYFPSQDWFFDDIIRSAEVVFVNFGAPEQEKFIHENRKKFSKAKILVGVGGTFDFLTGKIRRAPNSMRKSGLEWLWRLIQEPKRIKRIWNAVAVFPVVALLDK